MNIVYRINGETVSKERFVRKRMLHGGIPELVESRGRCLSLNTDTSLIARHNAETPEWRRRQIALAAKRAGKCEEQVYDPTLADKVLDPAAMFEGRGEMQRRIEHESRPLTEKPKPVYRLHPRLVREEIRERAKKDPDVLRRDRRELVAEIIDQHGSKE